MDRSKYRVRKLQLHDEPADYLKDLTPEQRIAMVWTLTVNHGTAPGASNESSGKTM